MDRPSRLRALVIATAALLPLTACSLTGGEDSSSDASGDAAAPQEVVLVTHDSFFLPRKLIKAFERDSGYDLVVRASGDAGTLTNKLVLSRGNPQGDVAFGVDNTFASRALDNDVFAPYSAQLPAGAEAYVLPGDDGRLTPVDNGNVCVNVDTTWFAAEGIAPPESLDDLVDPAYEDLFVLPGAASSSTGLAFLLATIARFGEDGWQDYWKQLADNGLKVTSGWSDAYEVDFTQGGGGGDRPIVLSYDSSPAFTIDGDASTTKALLDTCFRQVEYAGVLTGAKHPQAAQKVIDWMLSDDFQAALPENMYVYPVSTSVDVPEDWATYAPLSAKPWSVPADEIDANREAWLTEWTAVVNP